MTAAEAWLKLEMERIAHQARQFGLPVELSYSMTFTDGGAYVLKIAPEWWKGADTDRAALEEP